MSFNFPSTPTLGQSYTPVGGYQYVWDGTAWRVLEAPQLFATAQTRSRIVNPAMQISQENGDTAAGTAGTGSYFPADQWACSWTLTPGTANVSRNMSSLPLSPNGSGYVSVSIGTAKPALAAGDILQVNTRIEGIRVKDFLWGTAAARQAVLAFSAYSGVTGTFTVAVRNGATNRSFLAPFTVTVAAQWQQFSIVIPGDTTGTWAVDTSVGMHLAFTLASGSTLTGVAGWQSGNFLSLPSNTNLAATTTGFRVTDVGLYLDPDATGRAPQWQMPDEAEELRACQRYWQKVTGMFCGNITSSAAYIGMTPLPVLPRVSTALSGTNVSVNGFPATVGTLTAYGPVSSLSVGESRVANVTGNGGSFFTQITANARM